MKKMATALEKEGYNTLNIAYPSTQKKIEELAESSISLALSQCDKESTIHFVTHSMGGILLRQYLQKHAIPNIGRVVMLGPPNNGSEIVDRIGHLSVFKWINGPAGNQLGTDKNSLPNQLGTAPANLGVIAGTRSFDPFFYSILPKPHDGKVSVASSKLDGMDDHIQLPTTHTFMMFNRHVIKQVLHFLKHGVFAH